MKPRPLRQTCRTLFALAAVILSYMCVAFAEPAPRQADPDLVAPAIAADEANTLTLASFQKPEKKQQTTPADNSARRRAGSGGRVTAPPGKTYVYKKTSAGERELEVYFPPNWKPGGEKVPAIVMFHGGGWTGGSRGQFRYLCHYFASRGLVAATVTYTLAENRRNNPDGTSYKRVCIVDAKSAIRWMKQHADELGIDPERMIAGGGSAGGHICLLSTVESEVNDPNDDQEVDTSVTAYLLFNPGLIADDKADPAVDFRAHLEADFSPAIVFFGSKDRLKAGWDAAHEQLESLGNKTTELYIAPEQSHGFFNRQPWADITLVAADKFLAKHGLLTGEPTLAESASSAQLIAAE